MKIPRAWRRADGDATGPDGRALRLSVWGWGDNDAEAAATAAGRLATIVATLRGGGTPRDDYEYGLLPVREEIVREVAAPGGGPLVVTRNRYGALVLNVEDVLILDIDLAPAGALHRLLVRLGLAQDREAAALQRLRELVAEQPRLCFRVYRTFAGLRAIEMNRALPAGSAEAERVMVAVGTDPLYARLCRTQQSFRARLTPKPWRCGATVPPGAHPREDAALQQAFATWRASYDARSAPHAVCAFVDTVGTPAPAARNRAVAELHDRETGVGSLRPLA
ncbi:MAG TPA: hypothetical protein VFV15_03405 [Moraxellaceae bacterium]|nr:hypothetical protein [Moraxellaceae bacterium]